MGAISDTNVPASDLAPLSVPQRSSAQIRFGDRFSATAEIAMTPVGLLAVGAMVTGILLGSAAIVRAVGTMRGREAESD